MKRVLIIDNDTGAMKDIKESLKGENYEIIHHKKFKAREAKGFTHVILSGGDYWPTEKKFPEEIKLIRNPSCPIFGICLGMQLIGIAFGSKMKHLDNVKKGNFVVEIIKKGSLFENIPRKIKAFEYRGHAISKLGEELVVLAKSRQGIEAIKHKSLPIYGVQFHPEVVFKGEKMGRRIIKNFLKLK